MKTIRHFMCVLGLGFACTSPTIAQVTTVYDYDAMGRLCRVRYGDKTTDYHLDDANNRTQKTTIAGASSGARTACPESPGTPSAGASSNSPPTFTREYWTASSPGRFMSLHVSTFTSDPDGDAVTITSAAAVPASRPVTNVTISGGGQILSFNAPRVRGRGRDIDVTISDSNGATASKNLEIETEEKDD